MNELARRIETNRMRHGKRNPEGFLYVAVLFTSLVVMVAVATALSISTMTVRSENVRSGQSVAVWIAESEVQRQLAMVSSDAAWRDSHTHQVFADWHPLTFDGISVSEDASVRHMFSDPDGDLSDDDFDSVLLTVHARVGTSHAAVSVELVPDPIPLRLLDYAITASDDIRFEDGGAVVAERNVQVTDNCQTNSWGMMTTPQLECSGSVQMFLRGQLRSASVELPTRDVVQRYIDLGTEIPINSIPRSNGNLVFDNTLLTANVNPFGATDSAGIYWIDAGGQRLVIANSRIEATLAVTNCATVEINGGVVWHYPTTPDVVLATNTFVLFDEIATELNEADSSVNFNPVTAPFRDVANATTDDVYATELRGIVYSTSNLQLTQLPNNEPLSMAGSIIARDLRFDGRMSIRSLNEVQQFPPPGLSDPTPMRLLRGSYRRIPTPDG
ncbi:MAG: hypothetical protein AAGG48_12640 [Planctomycetota bacterium]